MDNRRTVASLLIAILAVPLSAAPRNAKVSVNPTITISVDAAANRHAIDPRIYGASFASAAAVTDLGLTVNRWGGNAMSTYNWSISTANRCKDFYFENIEDSVAGDGTNGESADAFIQPTLNAGAQALITIPMVSLLPASQTFGCSFPISVYGAQDDSDIHNPDPNARHPDCGNGMHNGIRLRGVNPAPTSQYTTYTSAHQADWIQHNVNTFGSASSGGVKYYGLDNEPGLWSYDHWDMHPNGTTYDEEWNKWADYGPAIKAVDPGALLTGPEEWGWSGYFDSGIDSENGNSNDQLAHGGKDLTTWLLLQAKAYEQAHGLRILDILTMHYYPQGNGDGSVQEFSDDTSNAAQLLRNQSTRSLWDTSYVDQSWIGGTGIDGGVVKLIPRLKAWVANNYPGTKIGITEYNWGADGHINGGTTQADILGIFGREGLDMGVRWDTPPTGSYTYNAFKMYRNYDGAHSGFGDISVSTSSPDPDNVSAFTAVRSSDNTLTIMLDAKRLSSATDVTVNLANFTPNAAAAQQWQLGSANVITHLADVPRIGSSLQVTVPAQSITLLVLPGATTVAAPTGFSATATSTSSAHLAWTGVGGATSYEIWRAYGGAALSLYTTVTGTTFDDTGLSSDTTYLYKVRAATPQLSAFTPIDPATTIMFTDDPLSTGTTAKAAHITQLRTAVNAMRVAAGLTSTVFTDAGLASGTTIRAVHITDLRTALDQARSKIGLSTLVYTDPTITLHSTTLQASHITDLRNGVK